MPLDELDEQEAPVSNNRLTRDMQNAMLGGVCAGIARHYDYDVTVVRVVWLLLTALSAGFGIILYVVVWIVMPRADSVSGAGAAWSSDALSDEVLSVGERIAESARVVARATRDATEEIAEIARGRATPTQDADQSDAAAAGAVPTEQPPVDGERRSAASPPRAEDVSDEEIEDRASSEEEQERSEPDELPGEQRRQEGGPPPGAPV